MSEQNVSTNESEPRLDLDKFVAHLEIVQPSDVVKPDRYIINVDFKLFLGNSNTYHKDMAKRHRIHGTSDYASGYLDSRGFDSSRQANLKPFFKNNYGIELSDYQIGQLETKITWKIRSVVEENYRQRKAKK